MKIVDVEDIKKILNSDFPIYNHNKIKFTINGLVDKDKRPLFTGDIVWFEYGVLKEKRRGVVMFGEYQVWIFGTHYKFLGFYILPMEEKIEFNIDIYEQMIDGKLIYGGNIFDGQKKNPKLRRV